MAYKDWEMMAFSEIACIDLDTRLKEYRDQHPEVTSVSLRDLGLNLDEIRNIQQHLPAGEKDCFLDWKIASVMDDTGFGKSGFYGCVIETSSEEPKEAAVAFRASGDFLDAESLFNDYYLSDIGLLNSEKTIQEGTVDRFLSANKELLEGYSNVAMTGHSLGGALADYATVRTEYLRKHNGLNINVTQCANLDGPGHSKRFMELYKEEIEAVKDKTVHYQWSRVGGQMWNISGTVKYIETKDDYKVHGSYSLTNILQHDRGAVIYDSNGNLQYSTDYEIFCKINDIGKNSRLMDDTMYYFGTGTVGIALCSIEVGVAGLVMLGLLGAEGIVTGYDALINWNADRIEDFVNGWNSFWDMVLGRNEDLTPEQIAANTAKAECETTPGFVICPAVYVALAEATQKLSTELDEVTSILRGMGDLTSPAKWAVKTVSNPHGSSKVANVNKQISNKAGEMAGIIRGVSSCYSEISSTKNTVDGIAGYLYYTGNGILEIENEAKRMVSLWDTPPT